MLSFYSVLDRIHWCRPENTKGTMGMHQKSRAPLPCPKRMERTTGAFCLRTEMHLGHSQCASAKCFLATYRLYTFSFSDAKKARNRLWWIGTHGKWQESAGTLFSGSYHVQMWMVSHEDEQLTMFCNGVNYKNLNERQTLSHLLLHKTCEEERIWWLNSIRKLKQSHELILFCFAGQNW